MGRFVGRRHSLGLQNEMGPEPSFGGERGIASRKDMTDMTKKVVMPLLEETCENDERFHARKKGGKALSDRRILVHACCGPCALEPVRLLQEEGFAPTIFWSNPNIQPVAERDRRKETLIDWARDEGIEVLCDVDEEARVGLWERVCAPKGFSREARCRACYAMRLAAACDAACRYGFEYLATTLAVSPYQLFDTCDQTLRSLALAKGLIAVSRDWRSRYPEATKRARELGLYRQNYCGCRFSAAEAQRERQLARDARKAQRAKDPKESIQKPGT